MSWIRFAVAGIALCAGASVASAQGGPPMGGQQGQRQGGGRGMQALFEGITLSDAQQTKMEEIRAKYRPQMEALRPAGGEQAGPPDKATRDKMEDIQEKQTKEIRAILSDDQQKIFDVNVAAMKKRREEMMKQREGKN